MRITPLASKNKQGLSRNKVISTLTSIQGQERCSDHTTLKWAIRWYQVMFEVFSITPRFLFWETDEEITILPTLVNYKQRELFLWFRDLKFREWLIVRK